MKFQRIQGSVALVTGANRGIGRALTEALLSRGARKVYATARDPRAITIEGEARLIPLRLDVTDAGPCLGKQGPARINTPRRSGITARNRRQTPSAFHGACVMKCWNAW